MQSFWKGELNLFSLTWVWFEQEWQRFSKENSYKEKNRTPLIVTREVLRMQLVNEMKGIKRTSKANVTRLLEYQDKKNSFYETFAKEDWSFYQRVINRLNRNYEKNYQSIRNTNKEIFGAGIILQAVGKNYIALYVLNTLSVEVNDLIKVIKNNKSIKDDKRLLAIFSNIDVKQGYPISDEFIFNRYLNEKENNPNESDTAIAKSIFKEYQGLWLNIKSAARVRRIISEQKRLNIKNYLECYPNAIFKDIAEQFFTDTKHVKSIKKKLLI